MKELSDYYFINENGLLCCYIEGKIYLVIGAMETDGGFIHFEHKPIEVNK